MQSRRLRFAQIRLFVVMAVVSAGMGFAGSALAFSLLLPPLVDAQSAQVRADHLVINSESGADRVLLKGSPGPAEGAVQLIDINGKPRIGVEMGGPDGTIPNAFGFHLRTDSGTVIGNLGVINDVAGVALSLTDQQGHQRINLQVDNDGTPTMQLLDAAGNVTWSAP